MSAIQMEPRRHTATHSLNGSMSEIQIKPRRHTATHKLDGIHGSMSAIQIKPRRHTATHMLDGILWQHVSNSNRAQEAHTNSQTGWNFMAACQHFKSPGGTQQLTCWMGFHGAMSAIQMEPRRHSNSHPE